MRYTGASTRTVLLLGPDLNAVSGISTHLSLVLGSPLGSEFKFLHFRVGSEGRQESAAQKVWRFLSSPCHLFAVIATRRPSIVHIHTAMDAKAFWRDLAYLAVARLCGRKIVLQVHGGALPQEFTSRALFARLLRRVLSVPDRVLLLGRAEYDAYRAFLPGLRALVVANAVETDGEAPMLRERLEAGNPLKLVYVGRLVASKGMFEALDAIAILRDEGLPVEFTVAGSGVDEGRLRAKVAELGLEDRIRFAGPVFGAAKQQLWRAAQVLVLPSHREAMPYALLEAMAAGVLPVTCPVGAIPDLVTDGEEGLFVPPREPLALAAAIRWVHLNRVRAAAMAAAAQGRVARSCSVARLVADFRAVYDGL
jgi:glycosyltransferase involved in cell wall biosynthesis